MNRSETLAKIAPALDMSRVEFDPNGGCWLWSGTTTQQGYGTIYVKARRVRVHRLSWALHHGDFPDGLVCHRCDIPSCVNPGHLFVGTLQDNHADMVSKGRHRVPPAKVGSANPKAKLTEEDVRAIRKSLNSGRPETQIRIEYGVSQSTINRIARGASWRHVEVVA